MGIEIHSVVALLEDLSDEGLLSRASWHLGELGTGYL